MMTEISLNILDIAENSTRAGASLVTIQVLTDTARDTLTVVITDNGCGMDASQLAHVTDPFFTTRTTRKVGLGVPFFKSAAEMTGGNFSIVSTPGRGTTVTALFILSHVDRMPLGDMSSTIHTLVICHPEIDFLYIYQYNDHSFTMDTRQFRDILGDVPLNSPEVSAYIMDFLTENRQETDGGINY